jgi:hypothetical protein
VSGTHDSKVKYNYLKGNDISKHYKNNKAYQQLDFGRIYDNIECTSTITNSNIEKIYTIFPGGDPFYIRIKVEGAKNLNINNEGLLEFATDIGILSFTKPCAYQIIDDEIIEIEVSYVVSEDTYGFDVGLYNKDYPLIIDPLIVSSYFGGTGINTKVRDITKDNNGNIYVTGKTASCNFPTTAGAYDESYNGFYDVFISKFDKDFSTLLSSTFCWWQW